MHGTWTRRRSAPFLPVLPTLRVMTQASLYEQVGGLPFFERLVDRFYDGVEADDVLLPLYPDRSDLVGARRVVPWAYAAATVIMVVALWGARKSDGRLTGAPHGGLRVVLLGIGQALVAACLVAAIVSLVRYRSGDEVLRLRVRWLMLAGVAIVALLVAGLGDVDRLRRRPRRRLRHRSLIAIVVLVPTAVAVAIVRHDLFDIDRLLSQSTAWMVTLVLSAAVFGVVVLGVSEVVSRSSGLRPDRRRLRDRAGAAAAAPLRQRGRRPRRGPRPLRGGGRSGAVRGGRPRRPEGAGGDRGGAPGAHADPGLRLFLAEGDAWVDLSGDAYADTGRPDPDVRWRRDRTDLQHERCRPRPPPVGGAVACGRGPDRGVPAAARAAAPAGHASSRPRSPSGGGSSATCTTAPSSGSSRRGCGCDDSRAGSTRPAPPRWTVAVAELEGTVAELRRWRTACGPAVSTTAWCRRWRRCGGHPDLRWTSTSGPLPDLDEVQVLSAYLVVSEAVTNSLKHARATHVGVRVADRNGAAVRRGQRRRDRGRPASPGR